MCSMIVLTIFVENQGESGGLEGHNLSYSDYRVATVHVVIDHMSSCHNVVILLYL